MLNYLNTNYKPHILIKRGKHINQIFLIQIELFSVCQANFGTS